MVVEVERRIKYRSRKEMRRDTRDGGRRREEIKGKGEIRQMVTRGSVGERQM